MNQQSPSSTRRSPLRLIGWILTGLSVAFLVFDGVAKILKIEPVMKASAELEVPTEVIPGLGIVLVTCALIYAFPPTAVLGAILLTGYLGGATYTHVRMGGPVFPVIFPSIVGALVWGGIYLRDARLRRLVPWSTAVDSPSA